VEKRVKTNGRRKVHITLPEEMHQRLRIKCAIEDVTIQEFVAHLIEKSLVSISMAVNDIKVQSGA
jgi:hypothetical protein